MPSEARSKEDLPFEPGSDKLMVQGATVPLDKAGDFNSDNSNGAGGAGNAD